MPSGVVRWFSEDKGYGMITPDDGGPDVRVEQTAVPTCDYRALLEGLHVDYRLEDGPDGPRAVAVCPV